jgi:acetyl esterase/lipase
MLTHLLLRDVSRHPRYWLMTLGLWSVLPVALALVHTPDDPVRFPSKKPLESRESICEKQTASSGVCMAADLGPANVTLVADVPYAKHEGAKGQRQELQLDLAYPTKGTGKRPVVVLFHGGGWVHGNRKTHTPYIQRLAEQGFVAVAVSYRLAPAHPYPAAIHDAKAAVRWLRANALKYSIDPDQVAAIGYSAGGSLALLLATTNGRPEWEGDGDHRDQSSAVQAAVAYYPLTDLSALHRRCQGKEISFLKRTGLRLALEAYLGGPPEKSREKYAAASPLSHVSKMTAPTLLIHGVADQLVPVKESELFAEKLRQMNGPVSLLTLERAGHDFAGDYVVKADAEALRFLRQTLRPSP